jgi:hypothetical protein
MKHEADVLAPIARQRRLPGPDQIMVAPTRLARAGRIEPAENVEQRRLARARRPQHDHELALKNIEIDLAQRMHRDLAHLIGL